MRSFHVEIYPIRLVLGFGRTQWRWRAVADGNGEVLASGESYFNKGDMLETLRLLFGLDVEIIDLSVTSATVTIRPGRLDEDIPA